MHVARAAGLSGRDPNPEPAAHRGPAAVGRLLAIGMPTSTSCARRRGHVRPPTGYYLDINLTGATLLGKERKHILGYPFGHFVAVNDRMRWLEHLRSTPGDGSERHQRDRLANRPRDCSHAGPYPVCLLAFDDLVFLRRGSAI